MDALFLLSRKGVSHLQATATFNLTFIEQSQLQIAVSTFTGTVGMAQIGSLSFTGGGGGPYTLTTIGATPPGVVLSPLGVISGTPTAAGTTTVSVTVVG